jgi:hypothetical protein
MRPQRIDHRTFFRGKARADNVVRSFEWKSTWQLTHLAWDLEKPSLAKQPRGVSQELRP